jgi:hypothetical protein
MLEVAIVAFQHMLAYEETAVAVEEESSVAEPEAVVPI